ncbi:unnamed protein product [Rotaria sp. Silwood1]|nr:unnamed protein product [Rotaria sp. Silwood1]CAF3399294.1 unnamed protein product [Rotaria sp. Silwood1]CAF3419534.1 unnamed protein product [Rotaria sp. Silwood1]CAF3431049.1 unnamed protein product [Rotaria sp. Silwood1]CAF3435534.1 unnamed protein product [Rotaria sp. Silwood1]
MSCSHRQHQHQDNDIIYQKDSLLKYESPRLIVSHDISDTDYKKICRATISPSFQPISLYDTNLKLFDPYSDLCRPAYILDFLFPPIEHIDKNNHKYIICVSRHPATITDVYNLQKNLDRRLKLSQALEVGLCNHRRKIYNECFDELVRQITIECSERGILLSRIRNTYRQMMNDYLNNYLSANAYAMRTFLLNEEIKIKLNNQIDHLQYDIEQIKKELINAEDHFENILKLYSKFKSTNEYRYESINITIPFELQQLRTTNKLLKQELENVLCKKLNINPSERINKKNEDELENIKYDIK